jgi:hypothetical protein
MVGVHSVVTVLLQNEFAGDEKHGYASQIM